MGDDESLVSKRSLYESNLFGERKIHADFDQFRKLVKNCSERLKLPFTVPNNRSPSIIRISRHRTQNPSKSLRKPLLGQKDDDMPQVR